MGGQVWAEDGVQWEQRVWLGPVTREAVLTTKQALDLKLVQQSAREEGICQVLTWLFSLQMIFVTWKALNASTMNKLNNKSVKVY